jgi:hypothetical protein
MNPPMAAKKRLLRRAKLNANVCEGDCFGLDLIQDSPRGKDWVCDELSATSLLYQGSW